MTEQPRMSRMVPAASAVVNDDPVTGRFADLGVTDVEGGLDGPLTGGMAACGAPTEDPPGPVGAAGEPGCG
jgi:hypothetical protein